MSLKNFSFKSLLVLTGFASTFALGSGTIANAKGIPHYSHRIANFAQQRKPYHYTNLEWNTRDLGNYSTYNGKIKMHRIIRTSKLNNLNGRRIHDLKKLHVTNIIDLRTNYDKRGNRIDTGEYTGRVPHSNIHYIQAPTYQQSVKNSMPHDQFYHYFYSDYAINNPYAIRSYRTVFHTLLSNRGTTMFHCINGQDRTGVTAALILSSLGANRNEVYNDYLLSNHYQQNTPMRTERGYIHSFYHNIYREYGSISKFLHKKVGLSYSQLHQLRHKYVQSNLEANTNYIHIPKIINIK